jgi:hypothetical protein
MCCGSVFLNIASDVSLIRISMRCLIIRAETSHRALSLLLIALCLGITCSPEIHVSYRQSITLQLIPVSYWYDAMYCLGTSRIRPTRSIREPTPINQRKQKQSCLQVQEVRRAKWQSSGNENTAMVTCWRMSLSGCSAVCEPLQLPHLSCWRDSSRWQPFPLCSSLSQ